MRLFRQGALFLLAASSGINAAYIPSDTGNPADLSGRAASPAKPIVPSPRACPNFSTMDPQKYIGYDPPLGKCNWKQALICSSLVVACATVCVAVAGTSPWAIPECMSCIGVGAGNCAYCFSELGGVKGVCTAMERVPYAKCLKPMCETPEGKLIAPHSVW